MQRYINHRTHQLVSTKHGNGCFISKHHLVFLFYWSTLDKFGLNHIKEAWIHSSYRMFVRGIYGSF